MNAAAHVMKNGMFRVIALLALTVMTSIAAQPVGAQEEPAVVDPTSCGHFETQADATEALHSGKLPDPENLDADGDGIACEMRWPVDPDSPPAVYEPTSCGHFSTQADAQAAFDSGTLPDPENLDADGDGVVCEFRWGDGEPDGSEAPTGGTEADSAIVSLPNTGTGPGAASGYDAMLAAILALVSAAGALSLRRRHLRAQPA